MLRALVFVLLGVLVLVGVVALVGALLPKGHRASRTTTYAAPPERVFAVISDFAHAPDWRPDVTSVELLPDDGHGVRFREHGRNGAITYRVEELAPPAKLVTRIDDTGLAFGGRWIFELSPSGTGTVLTITEDGEVYNPIFRFMSKYVISEYASIDRYRAALKTRLGE